MMADILRASWLFWVESAPWLLFGFFVAGLMHSFLSGDFVERHLGRGKILPVIKAALIGTPLPLCSCSVVPAAMGLRQKGASKGAVISFMISTPETGIDSIAVTYALLDPVMAVIRPVSAIFSALLAGIMEVLFGGDDKPEAKAQPLAAPKQKPLLQRIIDGQRNAFLVLFVDLAPWIIAGTFIGGFITALVPDGWFGQNLGGPFASMLVMLAVGVPMYICASASTPLAAAMILKGLNPGAALVFLLAGPATNTASILALSRAFGWKTTARYLLSLSLGALTFGVLLDWVYARLGIAPVALNGEVTEGVSAWASYGAIIIMTALSAYALAKLARARLIRKEEGG